jgi:DNA repair photolyase
MTASTANTIVVDLLKLFPSIAAERAPDLARQIERHEEADVRQAVTEYIDSANEKYLEITRLLAIAFRIARQRRDKEALKNQEHNKHLRYGHETHLQRLWAEADAWIADTSDEDLAALKADVLAGRPDLANVLKNRAPRMSITLRGLIYERATGKRVAV